MEDSKECWGAGSVRTVTYCSNRKSLSWLPVSMLRMNKQITNKQLNVLCELQVIDALQTEGDRS